MRSFILACLLAVLATSPLPASDEERFPVIPFKSFDLTTEVIEVLNQQDPVVIKGQIHNVAGVLRAHQWYWLERIARKMGFELPHLATVESTFQLKKFSKVNDTKPQAAPSEPMKEVHCGQVNMEQELDSLLDNCTPPQLKAYLGSLLKIVFFYDVLHSSFDSAPESVWKNADYIPVLAQEVPRYLWENLRDCYNGVWMSLFSQVQKHMQPKKNKTGLIVASGHLFDLYDGAAPPAKVKNCNDFFWAGWYIYSPFADQRGRFEKASPLVKLLTPRSRLIRWAISNEFPAIVNPAQERRIRYLGVWGTMRQGGDYTGIELVQAQERPRVVRPAKVEDRAAIEQEQRQFAEEERLRQAEEKIDILRVKLATTEKELRAEIARLSKERREADAKAKLEHEKEVRDLESRLATAEREKADLEVKVRSQTMRIDSLLSDLRSKQAAAGEAERTLAEFKAKKERHEDAQAKALDGKLANLNLEITNQKNAAAEKAKELESARQQLEDVQAQAKREAQELAKARAETAKAKKDLEEVSKRFDRNKTKHNDLADKIKQQHAEKERRLRDELARARQTLESQKKILEAAQAHEQELADDEVHMNEQERTIAELECQLRELTERELALQKDHVMLYRVCEGLDTEVHQLRHLLEAGKPDDDMTVLMVGGEAFPLTSLQIIEAARAHIYNSVVYPRMLAQHQADAARQAAAQQGDKEKAE